LSSDELPSRSTASIQTAGDILADLETKVAALNAVADDVYARWASNLRSAG
jgi:hypothetical protein